MPGLSPKWKTPSPLLTESANMDDQIGAMALALDNIAKDLTQNTLANRPAAGKIGRYYYATDYSILFRDNGTAWTLASQAHLITAPDPLPSNPDDGMIVDYLADPTLGIVWRFKYRAAAISAYKWEFRGNGPAVLSIAAAQVTTTSTTYTTLAGGPSIDIPLAGEWLFEYGAHMMAPDAAGGVSSMSPDISSAGVPTDNDAVYQDQQLYYYPISGYLQSQQMNMSSRERKSVISTSRSITVYYRSYAVGRTSYYQDRWIKATPVRVG